MLTCHFYSIRLGADSEPQGVIANLPRYQGIWAAVGTLRGWWTSGVQSLTLARQRQEIKLFQEIEVPHVTLAGRCADGYG